jgi:hypothetical protein
MLFLVVTLTAWAVAQSSPFGNISSAVSGQSQLTNFSTYLGLFPTLATYIDAGNITGMVTFCDGKDICALMEPIESLSTFR